MNFDKELDARGLNCPLPIVRTRQTGHELVSHDEANREFTFFMRKK